MWSLSLQRAKTWTEIRRQNLNNALNKVGLSLPVPSESSLPAIIDTSSKSTLSAFIRKPQPQLHEFVEPYRCQTLDDYRPNKSIVPAVIKESCASYDQLERLLDYAENGVEVKLSRPMPDQTRRPANHGSALQSLPILLGNLRAEQDAGRVLLLDADILEIWPYIQISPFGIVAKSGKDPSVHGRTIHDLAFPPGLSVNDHTDRTALPKPAYESCAAIAHEILRRRRLESHPSKILTGDVASAFRHVGIHCKSIYLFAGMIPELNLLIIDLCCPFGWTGSPSCYETFGGAIITHLHRTTSITTGNSNFGYHWVDDHVCVAVVNEMNCLGIEHALRLAMIDIMGAESINEAKFSGWHHRLKVLGLIFDASASTVSIPPEKLRKARNLVWTTYHKSSVSISEFRSLLGSLRHISTCLRPARPFLQRLRQPERKLLRYTKVHVTDSMRQDLLWWWSILQQPVLNHVPMQYFHGEPAPYFTVEVDAAEYGCCALDVTRERYFCYQYNEHELEQIALFHRDSSTCFDINYRELLTCAFAASVWATHWSGKSDAELVHVHFRVDNMSAVSWQQKLSSPNPLAQDLIRLLSWWEVEHRIRFSAYHIPGIANIHADAGSRASVSKVKSDLFTNLVAGWIQDNPPQIRIHDDSTLAMYLREHSVADPTHDKYKRAFGRWEQWCKQFGFPIWLTRVNTDQQAVIVSDFILSCTRSGRNGRQPKSGTIANTLHGINHFFKARALAVPVGHPQVCMLLKGLRRLDTPEQRKAPVTLSLLPISIPQRIKHYGGHCV